MTIEEKVNYMRIMGNIGSDVEDNLLPAVSGADDPQNQEKAVAAEQ